MKLGVDATGKFCELYKRDRFSLRGLWLWLDTGQTIPERLSPCGKGDEPPSGGRNHHQRSQHPQHSD
jgi:hypothetical protein